MEVAPGILRQRYEKKHRRDVAHQVLSLRTEWVSWRHSSFLYWSSYDHTQDPLVSPYRQPQKPAVNSSALLRVQRQPSNGTACGSAAVATPQILRLFRALLIGTPSFIYLNFGG